MRRDGPWRGVEDLELATLGWVHWFNEQRLHSMIGYIPPIEHEENYYRRPNATRQVTLSGEPTGH